MFFTPAILKRGDCPQISQSLKRLSAGSKVREPGPTEGSRFYRGTPGFMAVTLTAKEMHVEVIDYTGAPLYETRVQNRAAVGA